MALQSLNRNSTITADGSNSFGGNHFGTNLMSGGSFYAAGPLSSSSSSSSNHHMGNIFMPNMPPMGAPCNIFSTANPLLGLSKLDQQMSSVAAISAGGAGSNCNNSHISHRQNQNMSYVVNVVEKTTTTKQKEAAAEEEECTVVDEEIESKCSSDGNLHNLMVQSAAAAAEAGYGDQELQELLLDQEDDNENLIDSDNTPASNLNNDGDGDGDGDDNPRPTKKRYHRHTVHQIAEMERVFKEWPHPDDKQRQELSRELKLSPRQIKFWFQNKRTQMKAQHERQDNNVLRAENEKLKAENFALRDAVRNVACPSCGGSANLAQMTYEEQQLRIENCRLREEIERITAMAAKYIGRHHHHHVPSANTSSAQITTSTTTSGSGSPSGSSAVEFSEPPPQPAPHGSYSPPTNELLPPQPGAVSGPLGASELIPLMESEKPLVADLALTSAEELLHVAQAGHPLWLMAEDHHHHLLHHHFSTDDIHVPSTFNGRSEAIDQENYFQRFPRAAGVFGPTPLGMKPESSRFTGLVIMNSISLVETLMDVNRWAEMFPSIISRAHIAEVVSTGIGGTYDGVIQLMYAEFQLPSPLVPTRESHFLRYSKRVDNMWVVVDVSIDHLRGNPTPPASILRCRRRPSGCIIEELPNGYSKVTWVEHVEADNRGVHNLYQSLVSSGIGFGAMRWLCTLQRQCERIASVLANVPAGDNMSAGLVPSPEGRRSMLKLAERMTNNFCGGVSASTAHTWVTLAGNGGVDDVRVVIRKSVDDPGRPPGIVLSAATSIWLPLPPSRLFQFLRDERYRTEWDILSNTGVVEEMFHVAKGRDPGNCVSLLRVNSMNANQSNMLILQECCTDESCSLVVYAPVDIAAMSTVLNGGDPECVALLPSGFAILPDGRANGMGGQNNPTNGPGGSLLTVAFQILVDHVPTARLSLGSVATVNKLISNTVIRIKAALSVGIDDNAQ